MNKKNKNIQKVLTAAEATSIAEIYRKNYKADEYQVLIYGFVRKGKIIYEIRYQQ